MSQILRVYILLLAASICVSAQTYTAIHDFGSSPGEPGGLYFTSAIAQSRGGLMFTTSPGSQNGIAATFRIGPLGSLHVLHQFANSSQPGGLTLARDGYYYGITRFGGLNKAGTIFRMSQTGGMTKLHDFSGGSDGAVPSAAPIQSVEGDFYLTTGGSALGDLYGTVQRMTRDGNMTLLHAFNGSDGQGPVGVLVQGTDYRFYGVTQSGGPNDAGTIFRVSSSGNFELLYKFDTTHGALPQSGLIQASDGNFYGTTSRGGPTGNGVLYRITPSGSFTVLHDFTGGSDGGTPVGGLVQATDGNLYGTTSGGGNVGYGVIFRASLSGVVVELHNFGPVAGFFLASAPLQHTNGKLYGGTYFGGKFNQGVFYSLDAGLPPFVTYLPVYGRVGTEVQILGQGFTGTSQVFFNGTPATFKLVYPTFIKATVPAGATSGRITVTTANGTLTSNKVFIVHP
jgi:uncharacterized repeat protein (TIGR03803 family)